PARIATINTAAVAIRVSLFTEAHLRYVQRYISVMAVSSHYFIVSKSPCQRRSGLMLYFLLDINYS
ncbi:MAG: hypothetical protein ACW99H_12280, partial [Candidatus Thorarchaeota archaeon]